MGSKEKGDTEKMRSEKELGLRSMQVLQDEFKDSDFYLKRNGKLGCVGGSVS